MTSSETSTETAAPADGPAAAQEPPPPQRPPGVPMAIVVLAVAGVALIAGWLFVLWHHRFHLTAAAVVLMLGWAAVLSVVYFLWRTADNADLDDHEDWWKPAGRIDELEREKRSLLKAIKETELDRDTGKLSAKDAAEVIGRYRARAIGVIKAIEETHAGATSEQEGVRDRIEREVRARVAVDRSGDAKKKKASKGKGGGGGKPKTTEPEKTP